MIFPDEQKLSANVPYKISEGDILEFNPFLRWRFYRKLIQVCVSQLPGKERKSFTKTIESYGNIVSFAVPYLRVFRR